MLRSSRSTRERGGRKGERRPIFIGPARAFFVLAISLTCALLLTSKLGVAEVLTSSC